MKLKKKQKIVLFILIFITVVLSFIAFNNKLTITNYEIVSEKIKEPIKIVFLSDLHSCIYGENQEELIEKIKMQNPDLILMGGDIADDEISHSGTIDLLVGLSGQYACYYVTGNHEFWSKEVEIIKDIFRTFGVTVLEGDCKIINIKGNVLNICGVDDPYIGEDIFEEQLQNTVKQMNHANYTILLSHRPERIEQYVQYDYDLVLSGHAHGGQFRIPFILEGTYAPDQGIFPKYTNGIYEQGNVKMLVSRGLSKESTRIPRMFNPPEIVVIELSRAE